jgi:hypothetical protein
VLKWLILCIKHYRPTLRRNTRLNTTSSNKSDTPGEVPVAVTPKRESRNDDTDDDDAETIDLRELGTTPRFRDKQYSIRKEGNTLTIGNSVVDLDKPGVITVKGKRFKLTRGLWELLTLMMLIHAPFLLMTCNGIKAF